MGNPFKRIGFRQFIVKTMIFIIIGLSVGAFIFLYFNKTEFFHNYLDIPKVFQLEKPNFRTILINSLFFGAVAFLIISYKKLLNIESFKFKKHQLFFILLAVCFLCFQYIYKFIIKSHVAFFLLTPTLWGIIKILINICFIISLAIGVYGLNFVKYFIKIYKIEIILFSLISLGFYFITLLFQNIWIILSASITQILYHFFKIFFSNVSYKPFISVASFSEGGGPLLGLGNFSAVIGKPCSGIDSLLLFTSLYFLICILEYKRLKKGLAILFYFVGILGMFLTNILRIFLLFIIGAYINAQFAISMFHTNAGWILFIGYFFMFWWIVNHFLYKGAVEK